MSKYHYGNLQATDSFKDHFNQDLDSYEKNQRGIFKQRIRVIKYFFPKDYPIKICDIGCSTGYFLSLCEEEGFKCYGLEKYAELYNLATSKAKSAKIIMSDAQDRWGFEDGTMDCVTLFDILEHVNHPAFIIKEARRILKPGGIVFLTTPNGNFAYKMRRLPLFGIKDRTTGHIHVRNASYWRTLLNQCGFREIYFSYGNYLSHLRGMGLLTKIIKLMGLNPNKIYPLNRFSTSIWIMGEKFSKK